MKSRSELKEFLDETVLRYNRPDFIELDPISIPHRYNKKEDIEIAGFLVATIAWGQRPTILKNAAELIRRMDNAPHDFILNHTKKDLAAFKNFKHRTFNGTDCIFFLQSLQNIYKKNKTLEEAFTPSLVERGQSLPAGQAGVRHALMHFRKLFFSLPHPARTQKHVSDPDSASACKKLNMFLRWMVRKDDRGVDFGLWGCSTSPLKRGPACRQAGAHTPRVAGDSAVLSPQNLLCPLDVHSGNVARELGLLTRKQNDWQAVMELTSRLRVFDPDDPVKYDFALFGLGISRGKISIT